MKKLFWAKEQQRKKRTNKQTTKPIGPFFFVFDELKNATKCLENYKKMKPKNLVENLLAQSDYFLLFLITRKTPLQEWSKKNFRVKTG